MPIIFWYHDIFIIVQTRDRIEMLVIFSMIASFFVKQSQKLHFDKCCAPYV